MEPAGGPRAPLSMTLAGKWRCRGLGPLLRAGGGQAHLQGRRTVRNQRAQRSEGRESARSVGAAVPQEVESCAEWGLEGARLRAGDTES